MTNVEALKKVYKALGGDVDDVAEITTTAEMIAAIATAVASTIELPAVTGADDGNVLTVVSGKWAKAAIPSQLPAVSATDNGSVLKVVEGVWAVGEDNIQA